MGLSVERDKSIVVYAPIGTDEKEIATFVEQKKFWLYQKLYHTRKLSAALPQTPFKTGKAIVYLGQNYILEVVNQNIKGISYHENRFYISEQNREQGQILLNEWYRQKAEEVLLSRAKELAHRMGVRPKNITIRDLKHSWGSCTPNNRISFNWKLIKAPHYVIDYVIVHELAHLLELNHTPDFWIIVSIQQPRYKEAKKWLQDNGEKIF